MAQQSNDKSTWESVWLPRITTFATTIIAGTFMMFVGEIKDFVKDFYSFKLSVSNQLIATNTWISVFDSKQKDLSDKIEKLTDKSTKEDHTTFDKSYYLKPDDKFRIIKGD